MIDDIHSVAIDANGAIVAISHDFATIDAWLEKTGRYVDCTAMSFATLSELAEYLSERKYPSAIDIK